MIVVIAVSAGSVLSYAQGKAVAERAVFRVEHRPIDALAAVVRSHLGENGEIQIHPQTKTVIVIDVPDRIASIRRLVAQYDIPPKRIEVIIKLIEASQAQKPADVSEAIRDIGSRLQNVLRFSKYELLDTLVIDALEGKSASAHLGEKYRISFSAGYLLESGQIIPLENFRLDKVIAQKEEGRPPAYQNLVTTALNLIRGEEILFGASRMEGDGDKALILVIAGRVPK